MLRFRWGQRMQGVALAMALLVVVSWALPASAQSFPEKEIRLIVPWAPGGAIDIMARTLQSVLHEQGVRVVVENRPGGGSAIGMAEIAQARPDGYTVGLATSSILGMMALDQVPIRPSDFDNLVSSSEDPLLLLVHRDAPWATIDEFMEFMKANPGSVSVATPGVANVMHVLASLMADAAGSTYRHVPFDGGAHVTSALLGGHIHSGVFLPSLAMAHVGEGGLRALAVFRDERMEAFPDVPTFRERGYKLFTYGPIAQFSWIVAPKGLNPDVRERLVEIFSTAVQSEAYLTFAKQNGVIVDVMTGRELDEYIDGMYEALTIVMPLVLDQ